MREFSRERNQAAIARAEARRLDPDVYYDWEPEGCELCMRDLDHCMCEECPKCNETGNPECYEGGKCGGLHDVERPVPEGEMRPSEKKRYEALRDRLAAVKRPETWEIPTVDQVFEYAPEGDFNWDGEPGDSHAVACGEKDCSAGWHAHSYYEDIGRENGKRYVISYVADGDGAEVEDSWDERAGSTPEDWDNFALVNLSQQRLYEFFEGWARYFLHCANTNTDVLEEFRYWARATTISEYLDAAEDNIKYLEGEWK